MQPEGKPGAKGGPIEQPIEQPGLTRKEPPKASPQAAQQNQPQQVGPQGDKHATTQAQQPQPNGQQQQQPDTQGQQPPGQQKQQKQGANPNGQPGKVPQAPGQDLLGGFGNLLQALSGGKTNQLAPIQHPALKKAGMGLSKSTPFGPKWKLPTLDTLNKRLDDEAPPPVEAQPGFK
jgi:hypothetical protein